MRTVHRMGESSRRKLDMKIVTMTKTTRIIVQEKKIAQLAHFSKPLLLPTSTPRTSWILEEARNLPLLHLPVTTHSTWLICPLIMYQIWSCWAGKLQPPC
ncbi:wsv141 [White spot syndrome virus]|uniref:Wsv141 n=3 Tax=White spot syndrome virus TaxID=342409 RepID=Q8VB54_WSSVS|nr:wsv141 [Shrimp white spot syndrome virus]AFX59517.1 wsv141 [White spot syndrome virus]AAL33145.1 wsv141 [Shrimp white spot syndrome virus]AAL89064.1 WSSV196 [Shrimp white spot syndrome virus]AWQ60326.1 wsv141 [Shrimp white spot syndrome virus]AWQ60740.1 wsv141 [Shrimp white spot syndrome virus]